MLKYHDFEAYNDNLMKLAYRRNDLMAIIEHTIREGMSIERLAQIIKQGGPQVAAAFRTPREERMHQAFRSQVDIDTLQKIIPIAARLKAYISQNDQKAFHNAKRECQERIPKVKRIESTVQQLNHDLSDADLRRFQTLKSMRINMRVDK